MFGVISLNGFLGNNADVIAAGVVTGVGSWAQGQYFTGTGELKVLTTAATIWVAAGVGLAAAAGLYILAPVVTAISFLILMLPQKKRNNFTIN